MFLRQKYFLKPKKLMKNSVKIIKTTLTKLQIDGEFFKDKNFYV